MLDSSKKKSKVKGYVKYFDLEDFWLNSLSEEQRNEIKQTYSMGLNTNPDAIDKEDILSASMKSYDFLMLMSECISDAEKKQFLINWAIKEVEKSSDVIDHHYMYLRAWKQYKHLIKSDQSLYTSFIEILKKDCEIHDEFNRKYYRRYKILPTYPSFKELALAYERLGRIEEAIEISQMALKKKVNEKTSFERRIAKLEKKLKK